MDVLRGKIEKLTSRINAYANERPATPPLPRDFETAKQIASAETRTVEEKREELDNCEQASKTASSALQQAQINESNLAGKIEMARNAKDQATESLELARSQRADSTIASELAQAEEDARSARESLDDAKAELSAADPESLKMRLRNAQAAALRASDDLRANEQRQDELRIALSVRGEEGLHTRHEEAIGRLRHLEREHQRTEARAEAARLLHSTFSQRRQEARQRYSGPFKQRIEQLGRIVFNPSFLSGHRPEPPHSAPHTRRHHPSSRPTQRRRVGATRGDLPARMRSHRQLRRRRRAGHHRRRPRLERPRPPRTHGRSHRCRRRALPSDHPHMHARPVRPNRKRHDHPPPYRDLTPTAHSIRSRRSGHRHPLDAPRINPGHTNPCVRPGEAQSGTLVRSALARYLQWCET